MKTINWKPRKKTVSDEAEDISGTPRSRKGSNSLSLEMSVRIPGDTHPGGFERPGNCSLQECWDTRRNSRLLLSQGLAQGRALLPCGNLGVRGARRPAVPGQTDTRENAPPQMARQKWLAPIHPEHMECLRGLLD